MRFQPGYVAMILAGPIGVTGAAMRVGYLRGLPCANLCVCAPCVNTAQMVLAPAMPMMPVYPGQLMMGVAQSGMTMSPPTGSSLSPDSETLSEILAILKRLEVLLSESRPPVGPEVDAVLTDALPKLALHIGHGSSDPLFGLVHGWMNHFKAGAPFDVQGLASVIRALEETVASPQHRQQAGAPVEVDEGEEDGEEGVDGSQHGSTSEFDDSEHTKQAKQDAHRAKVVAKVVASTDPASTHSSDGGDSDSSESSAAAPHAPALRTEAFTPDLTAAEQSALAPATLTGAAADKHAALPSGASAASTTPHIADSAAGQPAALAPENEFEAKILAIEVELGEIVDSDAKTYGDKLVQLLGELEEIQDSGISEEMRAKRTALVEQIEAKIGALSDKLLAKFKEIKASKDNPTSKIEQLKKLEGEIPNHSRQGDELASKRDDLTVGIMESLQALELSTTSSASGDAAAGLGKHGAISVAAADALSETEHHPVAPAETQTVTRIAELPSADGHGASAVSIAEDMSSSAAGQAGAVVTAALAPEKDFEAKIEAVEKKFGEIVISGDNENEKLQKLVELQNGMPKKGEYETSDSTGARRTALVEKIDAKIASLKSAAYDAGKVGANEDAAANLVSGALATSGREVLGKAAAEHGQHGDTAPSANAQLVEVQSDIASGLQHSSDEDDEDNEGAAETAGLSTSDESENDGEDYTIHTATSGN